MTFNKREQFPLNFVTMDKPEQQRYIKARQSHVHYCWNNIQMISSQHPRGTQKVDTKGDYHPLEAFSVPVQLLFLISQTFRILWVHP